MAHEAEAAHANHGHHEVDDTHHASKGTEHSCSNSISISKNNLERDRPLYADVSLETISLSADLPFSSNHHHGFNKRLFERGALPKLFTEFYQLYSVYRI